MNVLVIDIARIGWGSTLKLPLGDQVTGDLAILTEGPSTRHPEAHNRMEIIDLRRQQEQLQRGG